MGSSDVSIYHPKTILLASLLTGSVFALRSVYRTFFRRIPTALDIPNTAFRQKFLLGYVTSVGDGDGFHFFHTPGGFLAGWGWLRFPPKTRKELKGQTWSVRIGGVDAPERAHFGHPAQPYSEESLQWLKLYILGKSVRVKPLRLDQYNRVVARVLMRNFILTHDLGEEMLKRGMAVVYEVQAGSEFDGQERVYQNAENRAKASRKGLWGLKERISPADFKRKNRN